MKKAPKGTHRSLAALNLPRSVPAIVANAQAIVAAMTDNPHVPAPVPALWLLSKAIADLQHAEAVALTRAKGAAAIRNEKRTMVGSLLQQLRGCVQVNADSDPENGAAIIASAGMTVKKPSHRPTRFFSTKRGALPGELKVIAPTAVTAHRTTGSTAPTPA